MTKIPAGVGVCVCVTRCGKIARVREKFVSAATAAEGRAADRSVRQFWLDFRRRLDTDPVAASAFKDVPVYVHRSEYDADGEPPDYDAIWAVAKSRVAREMSRVLRSVRETRAEYERFAADAKPVFWLSAADATAAAAAVRDDLCGTYGQTLNAYPDGAVTVSVVLDAMIGAIERRRRVADLSQTDDNDDDDDDRWPVCVPYGDRCALTVRKYRMRPALAADYARSALNAPNVRWKRTLWPPPARPLMPPDVQAECDGIVADVKSRCGAGRDVDVQLCVLGLNRLRGGNMAVYRGERIGADALAATRVRFAPGLVEPVGPATMVQILERESEAYGNACYAHLELEDAMLVGFHDDRPGTVSFGYDVPVPAVGARDYCDLFRGKRAPPDCRYAVASACPTYRERAENVRFRNGDRLTVTKRRWRFERETVCIKYKSERYEVVRHVASDPGGGRTGDDDRCRIVTAAGHEYAIDRSRGGDDVVGLVGRTGDGGTMVIDAAAGAGAGRVERRRRYGQHGRVVVEFADGTAVAYRACGEATAERHRSKAPLRTGTARYSADGASMTVEFGDGTTIGTRVREVSAERPGEDWARYAVVEYEYAHPAHRTVTVDRPDGTFRMADAVPRGADGRVRLRLPGDVLVDVTGDAIAVRRGGDDGQPVTAATFGWKGRGSLFEKCDGPGDATILAGERDRVIRSRTTAAWPPIASSSFFIVKRNMSGFRVLDRDRFDDDDDDDDADTRRNRAVHETDDGIVAVYEDSDTTYR